MAILQHPEIRRKQWLDRTVGLAGLLLSWVFLSPAAHAQLPPGITPEQLAKMPAAQLAQFAKNIPPAQITTLLDRLQPQQLVPIMNALTPAQKEQLQRLLTPAQRLKLQQLLAGAAASAAKTGVLPMASFNKPVKLYITLDKWDAKAVTMAEELKLQEAIRQMIEAGQMTPVQNSVYLPGRLELIHIPAGVFLMGSNMSEAGRMCDEDRHEVELTQDFWIGRFEVTQEQWRKVMGRKDNTNVIRRPAPGTLEIPALVRGDAYPIYNVSYEDARQFCQQLENLLRKSKGPFKLADDMEVTLPTEAQWEYACRAGKQTAFTNGNELLARDAVFHVGRIKREITVKKQDNRQDSGMDMGEQQQSDKPEIRVVEQDYTPVIKFAGTCNPNAFGLHDMHGSVWEWCRGRYYKYPQHKATNPPGGRMGYGAGVLRGGSWYSFPSDCRCARRRDIDANTRQNNIGFRIVISKRK